jgi:tripeptide aminopeptidase
MNEQRLFRLFEDLCKIDAPALQERASVDFTKQYLTDMGLEVWEDDAGIRIGGNANNVFARLVGTKPGAPKIFFCAHFDTVEPTAGLEIGLEAGVYSSLSDTILGADDKAGMAPAIEAVASLKENGGDYGDVFLVLCVAEEIGLKGAMACEAIKELGVDYGYVFDTGPPVGTFVNRVGSRADFDARIIGKPAHAGKHPEEGINAIQTAGSALAKMRLGRIDDVTTSNVGLIEGGSAVNVVPANVILRGEARSFDANKLQAQLENMETSVREACRETGAECEVSIRSAYRGYHIDEDEPVIVNAISAAKELGFSGALRDTLGGSDANAFNEKGVTTIVCGTGMEKIHTHDEYVSQRDLVDLTRLAIALARNAAR